MIRQLIQDLVYDNITLSQALTRAKLIAYKINDGNFKNWINNELNGYNKDTILPEYRVIPCSIQGKVADCFGNVQVIPILLSKLNKRLGGIFYKMEVMQSISSLEGNLKNAKGEVGQVKLHPELVNELRRITTISEQGFSLIEAGKEIQFSQLQNIVDLTKQSLIDTLLELNEAFPNMENEYTETKENKEKITILI